MNADSKLKVRSLLRRAGLVDTPKPVLACLCVVAFLLLGFALWRFWPAGPASAGQDFSVDIQAGQAAGGDASQELSGAPESSVAISVDVEGAVKRPGLYELLAGSRVGDAIEAAGGMTKKAARGAVNLAALVEDGQQVVVPKKGGDSGGGAAPQSSGSASVLGSSTDASSKVNINTASAAQLQQLPGIGELLSQRIVDYRQANGSFASVDDLAKVSGIGDTRLASIRNLICV